MPPAPQPGMPSAEKVNALLGAKPDQPGAPCPDVPDVPDHDHEIGAGHPDLRGQIPMSLPPVPEAASKHTGGSDAGFAA
jgi:hypothetical protein